jgi:predicted DNA-binding transcriptional regulator YafY
MATNKHATIRYHALDKCFSNSGRRYYIEDLIEECNNALYNFAGISDGIKRRQIFEDIKFMESEQGWSIPLERLKDGKRVYYRYSDTNYSIKNQALNQSEAEQLKETLSILARFKGTPQFDWIEEISARLKDTFQLSDNSNAIVGFEQNPYLKGLNLFTDIFNAIQNKRVVSIEYQGFRQKKIEKHIVHPWYLKQFNNRWFLFCYNDGINKLSNYALDRILSVTETNNTFKENRDIDFEEYFEDVIGVTVKSDKLVEKIIIKINEELWPYIESKPIHGSQKIKGNEESSTIIELSLQINYELISHLFGYIDGIEILEPQSLREAIKNKLETSLKKYI